MDLCGGRWEARGGTLRVGHEREEGPDLGVLSLKTFSADGIPSASFLASPRWSWLQTTKSHAGSSWVGSGSGLGCNLLTSACVHNASTVAPSGQIWYYTQGLALAFSRSLRMGLWGERALVAPGSPGIVLFPGVSLAKPWVKLFSPSLKALSPTLLGTDRVGAEQTPPPLLS